MTWRQDSLRSWYRQRGFVRRRTHNSESERQEGWRAISPLRGSEVPSVVLISPKPFRASFRVADQPDGTRK